MISVHGKWICLQNFLYTLQPRGSYMETHNPIPLEFLQSKCPSLLSRPVFPVLCTLVQGITITRNDASSRRLCGYILWTFYLRKDLLIALFFPAAFY